VDQTSPIFFRQRGMDRFFLFVDCLIRSKDTGDRNLELSEIARIVGFGWQNINRVNSVVSGPKFVRYFR